MTHFVSCSFVLRIAPAVGKAYVGAACPVSAASPPIWWWKSPIHSAATPDKNRRQKKSVGAPNAWNGTPARGKR